MCFGALRAVLSFSLEWSCFVCSCFHFGWLVFCFDCNWSVFRITDQNTHANTQTRTLPLTTIPRICATKLWRVHLTLPRPRHAKCVGMHYRSIAIPIVFSKLSCSGSPYYILYIQSGWLKNNTSMKIGTFLHTRVKVLVSQYITVPCGKPGFILFQKMQKIPSSNLKYSFRTVCLQQYYVLLTIVW